MARTVAVKAPIHVGSAIMGRALVTTVVVAAALEILIAGMAVLVAAAEYDTASGAQLRAIPPTKAGGLLPGKELFIPPATFGLFEVFRKSGQIRP